MRSVSKLTQGGSKGNVTLFTENDRHTAMYVNEISCGCTTRFREVRAVHKKANVVRRRRAHEGWYEAWRHALNLDRSNLGRRQHCIQCNRRSRWPAQFRGCGVERRRGAHSAETNQTTHASTVDASQCSVVQRTQKQSRSSRGSATY